MAVPITTAMQNQIAQNYIAILGRNPEAGGFNFWVNTYADAGGTPAALKSITNGFGNSAEFRGTYGGLSTEAAIALMYQNVLLRAADAGGLAYWTGIANGLIAAGETISNAYAQTGAQMIYTASSNGSSDSAGINARTAAAVAAGQTAPVTTYTLTTNVDTFGNAGSATQVFNAANGTFTPLDNLTGGSSGVDTLNISAAAAFTNPAGVTVTNVEIVNLANTTGATTVSTAAGSGFTGVTALNVSTVGSGNVGVTAAGTTAIRATNTSAAATNVTVDGGSSVAVSTTGGTTGTITIGATTAATGAVTVSQAIAAPAADNTGGAVAVTGGTSISVSQTAGINAANVTTTLGNTTIVGNASTTSVTVTQSGRVATAAASANVANTSQTGVAATSGVTLGTVAANGAAITTVTLQNYNNSTIGNVTSANALTNLNLSSTGAASGTLGVTTTVTSMALGLGGGSLGEITFGGNTVATLNVALTANTTLASIVDTGLRTVNLSGTGVMTLTTANASSQAVTALTATGAAGLNADVSGNAGLTSVNFSGTSGNNTLTLNSQRTSYTGGTGNDVITITLDATRAITGGTGTDTIVLNAATATFTAANTAANVSGFEVLGLDAASSGVFNLNTLGLTGVGAITLLGANIANNTEVTRVAAGTTLNVNAAQANTFIYTLNGTSGATSTVNVNLNGTTVTALNGGGTAGFTTAGLTLRDANGVGAGTVNIVSNASVFGGLHTITTLTSSAIQNLNISGTGSMSIGALATNSTVLNISDTATGNTANNGGTADGIVALTSTGNVLGAFNYSGTHDFTIGSLNSGAANITIANANTSTTARTGVLTVSDIDLADGNANNTTTSLTLTGAVALTADLTAGAGVTVASGTNNAVVSITTGAGADTITLGNGNNVVVSAAGADTITVGTGGNNISAGDGIDAITLGAGTAVSRINFSSLAAANRDTITGFNSGSGGDVFNADIGQIDLTGTNVFTGAAAIQSATTAGAVTVAAATNLLRVQSGTIANATDAASLDGTNLLAALGGAITCNAVNDIILLAVGITGGGTAIYAGSTGAGAAGLVAAEITLVGVLNNVSIATLTFDNFNNIAI